MSKWGDFHGRHSERIYTPVFNGFLEALIANKKAPLFTRVCAWVLRRSWGNHSDSCVNAKGVILTQSDCAAELGLMNRKGKPYRQQVNPVFLALARLKCLKFSGQEIFPIDDPTEEDFANPSPPVDPSSTNSEENGKVPSFQSFIAEIWASNHPAEYTEYQKTEQHYKELRTGILSEWNAFKEQLSERGKTNGNGASERGGQPVREGDDDASARGATDEEPILKGFKEAKQQASFSPEQQVENAVTESGLADLSGNRAKAERRAAARFANTPPAQREAVLEHFSGDLQRMAKRRNQPKSWGILVSAMEDAMAAIRAKPQRAPDTPKATPQEATVEERIRTLEELIAMSPEHPQIGDFRAQLEKLKRKPSESEGKAKAQRAGQG
jgi:hypothetical protein